MLITVYKIIITSYIQIVRELLYFHGNDVYLYNISLGTRNLHAPTAGNT